MRCCCTHAAFCGVSCVSWRDPNLVPAQLWAHVQFSNRRWSRRCSAGRSCLVSILQHIREPSPKKGRNKVKTNFFALCFTPSHLSRGEANRMITLQSPSRPWRRLASEHHRIETSSLPRTELSILAWHVSTIEQDTCDGCGTCQ